MKTGTTILGGMVALGLAAAPAVPLAAPANPRAAKSAVATPVVPMLPPVPDQIPVALLIDLSSGQTLVERDPTRRFVPASVTKVMTAYSAFKLISEGKLAQEREIVVSKELADEWSGEGSSMFLQAFDRVTVGQLLLGVTTVSANDGAVVLGTAAAGSLDKWIGVMNANAAELGMRDTHFGTPNGWPDEGRTFTSARDLAILAEAMITRYPELYHRYVGHRGMSYGPYTQSNHDPIIGVVDGADGIKTGFTRQAGYNFLGSAERNGRRLVMVLAGAPTPQLRNTTARNLIRWGFDAYQPRVVLQGKVPVGKALVQEGAQSEVTLRTEREVLASMPDGVDPDVTLSVHYRGPIEAPIAEGQKIAWLTVSVAGQQSYDVPLVAAEEVPRANLFQRLRNGLAALFA